MSTHYDHRAYDGPAAEVIRDAASAVAKRGQEDELTPYLGLCIYLSLRSEEPKEVGMSEQGLLKRLFEESGIDYDMFHEEYAEHIEEYEVPDELDDRHLNAMLPPLNSLHEGVSRLLGDVSADDGVPGRKEVLERLREMRRLLGVVEERVRFAD